MPGAGVRLHDKRRRSHRPNYQWTFRAFDVIGRLTAPHRGHEAWQRRKHARHDNAPSQLSCQAPSTTHYERADDMKPARSMRPRPYGPVQKIMNSLAVDDMGAIATNASWRVSG